MSLWRGPILLARAVRAVIVWGKEIPLPAASAWQCWARETLGRLERVEPVIPLENVREGRNGLPEIFDYVDRDVPMLLCMFEKRLRGYRAIGYA